MKFDFRKMAGMSRDELEQIARDLDLERVGPPDTDETVEAFLDEAIDLTVRDGLRAEARAAYTGKRTSQGNRIAGAWAGEYREPGVGG